jgi:hypothetical protein
MSVKQGVFGEENQWKGRGQKQRMIGVVVIMTKVLLSYANIKIE